MNGQDEAPFTVPRGTPLRVHDDVRRLGEGAGLRFAFVLDGVERSAFVVRYRGRLHAYVNACRHEGLELDFGDAHFFDDSYDALVCCHHGARYDPETGTCTDGPCRGARLTPLRVEQRGTALWILGPAERSG